MPLLRTHWAAETNVSELRTRESAGLSPAWIATSELPAASSPPMEAELSTGSLRITERVRVSYYNPNTNTD